MATMSKFKRTDIENVCLHFERGGKDGKFVLYKRQAIDPSKSYLNYNLAPNRVSQIDFINERTSDVKCLNRADINVMCLWLINLPNNFEQEKEFFKHTYDFLSDRYGEQNVISSFVHNDEKWPHMHFAFVPVFTDEETGIKKVSSNDVLNRNELIYFHGEWRAYLEKVFGKKVAVLKPQVQESDTGKIVSSEKPKTSSSKKQQEPVSKNEPTEKIDKTDEPDKIDDPNNIDFGIVNLDHIKFTQEDFESFSKPAKKPDFLNLD